jgi:hypothetical protein
MGQLGASMIHPVRLAGTERNRKEAAKFFDLAKTASSPILQGYDWRIAERYLLLQGNISK